MGRNDGASGGKKRRNNNRRSRPQGGDFAPDVDAGLWYDGDLSAAPAPSGSGNGGAQGSWDRAGVSQGHQRSEVAAGGRRRSRRRDDDDEDERGWWERPEQGSLQAFAAPSLEPWQEERLQQAYAAGRRKAQVQELARELDVDRSVVLGWFKEFALRPQEERDAILAARRAEARRSAPKRQQQQEAAPAAVLPQDQPRAGAGKQTEANTNTGFIPFYVRKQMGGDKAPGGKRLSGEVVRTLESIYDRTPFPSADMLRGLYELHRLPRDVAKEWFAARRAADGISSSTQKRTGRASLREKDRDIEGAFAGPEDDQGPGGGGGGVSLLSQLGPGAGGKADTQQPAEPAEPTVVSLSRREMAALRSSLPSPTKHKGRQMAEKMGIKTGPDSSVTQIGNLEFRTEEQAGPSTRERLRASWRYRAAGGQRLRLRGAAGRPGGSESGGGAAE